MPVDRSLSGSLQIFDLEGEIARLRGGKALPEGGRTSITLRKGQGMNVVLLVMDEGGRLEEHAAPGPISLSVREGRIRFSVGEESVEAGPETLLACDAGVRHTVEALTDAVCLITLSPGQAESEG